MDQEIDAIIEYVSKQSGKVDVRMVAADLAIVYPHLVDSVTTGMIQERISNGQ